MKSTGLFGKNSGRVGGVVYSNYRGEQVVRTYQPQVKNPNSVGQIVQRAKFKLVSQVGAVFGNELRAYTPSKSNESPRNAWVRAMLKKATYQALQKEAHLPVEDIVLTSSKDNPFGDIADLGDGSFMLTVPTEWQGGKIRVVQIGYNNGGEINIISTREISISGPTVSINSLSNNTYQNQRLLFFGYRVDATNYTSYNDYDMTTTDATLNDYQNQYASGLEYTRTFNMALPGNV